MPPAAIAAQWYTIGAAAIALAGVAVTLVLNGARAERQRRRDLHARALAAIIAYGEMPYRIQRRAPGAENRARLSDELSRTKAELDTCQVLLAADGDERLSDAFDDLYSLGRRSVGKTAHDAWNAPVIQSDAEMNQGELYQQLSEFNTARDQFADDLRTATLPRRKRASRWLRSKPQAAKLPWLRQPRSTYERRTVGPQDLLTASAGSSPPSALRRGVEGESTGRGPGD
jgi:hypothetical protein